MLNGLRTATYTVGDLQRARDWFADVIGTEPYFDESYYVGFDVGGYELGLVPAEEGASGGDGDVAYWGVDDIDAAVERLTDHGVTIHEDVQDVGEGIRLATVRTPFGSLLGIIENPNVEVG